MRHWLSSDGHCWHQLLFGDFIVASAYPENGLKKSGPRFPVWCMLTVQLLMLSKHSLRFWHCNRASALHMDCLPVCRWSQLEDEWSPFGNGNQKVYGPFPKDFAYSYTSVFVESVFIIERPLQTIRACGCQGFHYIITTCQDVQYLHTPSPAYLMYREAVSLLWNSKSLNSEAPFPTFTLQHKH